MLPLVNIFGITPWGFLKLVRARDVEVRKLKLVNAPPKFRK